MLETSKLSTQIDEVLEMGAIVLEPRDELDTAIIGYTEASDGDGIVAVYSVPKILDYFEKSMTPDEAQEHFEYNTVRALPYMGPRRPVLVYDIYATALDMYV
tara:strand:- start:2854 stop:3159 length:306 start_codon:yes stop_codon:yes gene_type:complete